jgi:hypothetical protein
MKRSDLLELEKTMMKEVVKRRQLGGYSADAEGILILCETLMKLLQYTIDEYPAERAAYQERAARQEKAAAKGKSK